jgi:hypothetical protein
MAGKFVELLGGNKDHLGHYLSSFLVVAYYLCHIGHLARQPGVRENVGRTEGTTTAELATIQRA